MTIQNQTWSDMTISNWARRWSWLLLIGLSFAAILWIANNTNGFATIAIAIATPFFWE